MTEDKKQPTKEELQQKILDICDDEPIFLFELNKVFANYDATCHPRIKKHFLDKAAERCDNYAESEFFNKELRPFLENLENITEFFVETTNISAQKLDNL